MARQMTDSDRDCANRLALGLFAACQVEGRVLNHLSEQGRQAGFRDLAEWNRGGTGQIHAMHD